VIFARQGALWGVPFDIDTLETTGPEQVDLRFTKHLSLGPGQYRLMFDLHNVFNDSTPLKLNNQNGAPSLGGTAWRRPQLIIPGWLVKFAFQIDF